MLLITTDAADGAFYKNILENLNMIVLTLVLTSYQRVGRLMFPYVTLSVSYCFVFHTDAVSGDHQQFAELCEIIRNSSLI